jgi:AcrR family transcriptional regulator
MQAAFSLARRDGVAAITLEAVASDAGISKGGLLYHFPSKDALVQGMVEELQRSFDASVEQAASADPKTAGRSVRAYLAANADINQQESDRWLALIGALVQDPTLLEPWRRLINGLLSADKSEGTDPVAAAVVRLAADGLCFARLLGTEPFAPALRDKVIRLLQELSNTPAI